MMSSEWQLLLERLISKQTQVLGSLQSLDEESLSQSPEPGQWSLLQILYHLMDAEKKSLTYLQKKLSSGDDYPKTGWIHRFRCLALRLAMRSPLRFKAPPSVQQPPDHLNFTEITEQWQHLNTHWRQFVDQLPSRYEGQAIYRHPVAGRMNLSQTLNFLIQHFDHHARQIEKRLKSNPKTH